MKEIIEKFISDIPDDYLYNEAGLQYELGVFLRSLGKKVKFEYNTDLIFRNSNLLKKEMDLYIEDNNTKICIELKFPTKGAYPRRMTQSVMDLIFLQQLLNIGVAQSYFIFISPLNSFFKGKENAGIYSYFRIGKTLDKFGIEDIPNFMKDEKTKKLKQLLTNIGNPIKKEYKLAFNSRGKYRYCVLKMEET